MTMLNKIKNWFRKKPYIRFYSVYPGVVDLFPPIKSVTIKRPFTSSVSPPNVRPVRQCPGILKVAATGWIITAPADFEITTNGDGVSFNWREPIQFGKGMPGSESYITPHVAAQTDPILDDPSDTLRTVVKVETPWRVECSDDIVFLQLPVTYNNESRFTGAIGILDPKYSHVINVQLFWKVLNGTTLIRAGTPLCQYIPIKRKDLNYNEFDVTIENAGELDYQKEKAYNFAANSIFLESDQLSSRLQRASKILTKYKHKG
jgi:hypothetical protein